MRPSSHKLNPTTMRAYDIRGEIGKQLFDNDAYYIGRAYATKIIRKTGKKNPVIAVGRDGRLSSPNLYKNLVEGITDSGAVVRNIGIGPSPMLYFATRHGNLDGGIMITGSHNPAAHNGFKMMYNKAPLFGEEIQEMGRMSESGDFENDKHGRIEPLDIRTLYVKELLTAIQKKSQETLRDMRVAWDPGNGAGGEITELLIKNLPGHHFTINTKIDGNFPAHHPDPSEEENLHQLKALMKKEKCHLGIAFDGDADRVGVIDDQGHVISSDHLMCLFAEDVLEENKGAKIIVDVKTSDSFFEYATAHGAEPIMWKTGHSFIKTKMAETGALLAGEMSGHIFFADRYFGFDDGIYAALRAINFFAKHNIAASEYIKKLPKNYATPEYRIEVSETAKLQIVEDLRAYVKSHGKQVNEIDGIRVKDTDGVWMLRSSNTQSVISLRAESPTEAGLVKLKQMLQQLLKPYGIADKII